MNPFGSSHMQPLVYLKQGAIYVSEAPVVVSTVLGSCVAVTLFSPRHRVGAICHGLLPACRQGRGRNCDLSCRESERYVECSICRMVAAMGERQIAVAELEAKMFGGADMFGVRDGSATVGRQNIDKAVELMAAVGLRLVASDVGGPRGRKIFFNTSTGEVLLRRLSRQGSPAVPE